MTDDPIVNAEQASTEETTSTGTEQTEQTQEQPFSEAQMGALQQLIADAKESGKREMQGIKDREIADAQRRVRNAEDSLGRVRNRYENLEPEQRRELELEDLQAENTAFRQREQQETFNRQQAEYYQSLHQGMLEHLSDLGVDPKDLRIDWGEQGLTIPQGIARFNKSVAKIVKEDNVKADKSKEQDAKDKLAADRKDAGLDSGDDSASIGAGVGSDAEFLKKFGAGDIPMTKVNRERYDKIKNKYE